MMFASLMQKKRTKLRTRFDFLPKLLRFCAVTSQLTNAENMNLQDVPKSGPKTAFSEHPSVRQKPSEEQEMDSPRRFVELGMRCIGAEIRMEHAKHSSEGLSSRQKRRKAQRTPGALPHICVRTSESLEPSSVCCLRSRILFPLPSCTKICLKVRALLKRENKIAFVGTIVTCHLDSVEKKTR